MNRPIVRLYGLVVLLFALLVAFTSRWTIFEASSLRSNPLNKRALLEQERIARGRILAADGTVLARSVRGAGGTYEREYPKGEEFAHAIGFSYTRPGPDRARALSQRRAERPDRHEPADDPRPAPGQAPAGRRSPDHARSESPADGDRGSGRTPRGGGCARSARRGGEGDGLDAELRPEQAASRGAYEKLTTDTQGRPLVNRATQFGYAPGSTFKVVTATAAIDTGQFTPQSTLSGRNDVLISGVPLGNDDDESFGQITLTEALAKSVNTVWAQVAEKLGKRTMARYMNRFGFDRKPELDYPTEQMSSSGEYFRGRILPPTSPRVDVGRMGIGQDKLEVVPLQMAEVAAAVANHGRLMAPHLTERIVDPDGRTVEQISPRMQSVVMKPSTATAVTGMMEAVVNEGTGIEAQIPGVQVAGKTGTAETQIGTAINNVWFIAFAPAANPRWRSP